MPRHPEFYIVFSSQQFFQYHFTLLYCIYFTEGLHVEPRDTLPRTIHRCYFPHTFRTVTEKRYSRENRRRRERVWELAAKAGTGIGNNGGLETRERRTTGKKTRREREREEGEQDEEKKKRRCSRLVRIRHSKWHLCLIRECGWVVGPARDPRVGTVFPDLAFARTNFRG